ncbi:MAG: phosphoglycerate mutase family protein [Balneolaceae bacterium]|nr:phosphoglycerate mutase family protein [Balneolaceae bacterium]
MNQIHRIRTLPLLLAALLALTSLGLVHQATTLPGSSLPATTQTATTQQATEITTFILVRHAEKATAPANDPALAPAGVQRSQRLAEMLAHSGVTAIWSTDFTRTQETARPLAEELGLEVRSYDPRRENLAEWLIDRTEGGTVLVVGHSNTIPMLANGLLGEERFEEYEESDYGNLLIVTLDAEAEDNKAKVLHLRF